MRRAHEASPSFSSWNYVAPNRQVVSTLPRWLDPRRPGLRRASAGALEPRYDRDVSPLPGAAVKIVQLGTEDLAAHGETGELCTRGYHVMAGQFDDPGQTAAAIDEDGWLRTGDLASMDEQGYCRIDGRLKDLIIRGGENIYPREIEQVLFGHPDVAEAVVLGVPDPRWGEQVAAFVKLVPGAPVDEDALFGHVRRHLAPHKAPPVWRFVDTFPLTASGKIRKFVLRNRLVAESRGAIVGTPVPKAVAATRC